MHVRKLALSGALLCGLAVGLGTASPAQAVCDAYSGGCATAPPTDIGGGSEEPATGPGTPGGGTENPGGGTENPGGGTENPGGGTDNAGGGTDAGGTTSGTTGQPATLPFTGGEIVLLTLLGAGALAGGTALVVAGRRRAHSPA